MRAGFAFAKRQRGFTLIELMVVVVIVAVLMAIALPAYQNQVIRGHRTSAKAEMLEIANRQEQFLLAERRYGDPNDISYTLPTDVSAFYTFSISTVSSSGVPEFSVRFTPFGNQASDGWLELDSQGAKTSEFGGKWER